MNLDCCALESNINNLIANLNNCDKSLPQLNGVSKEAQMMNDEKEYKTLWKEPVDVNESEQSGLLPKSTFHEPLKYTEVRNFSSSSTKQVEKLHSNNQYKTGDPPQKGRASLVRLQAVVNSPNTGVTRSSSSNPDNSSSKVTSSDSSHQHFQSTSLTTKSYDWTVSTSDNSHVSGSSFADSHYSSASEEIQGSSVLTSTSNFDEVPNTQEMQRFLTLDGQYVYGYKDPNGEFHFFYPTLNDRESHNEKERKRRSRVSDACSSLRKLVPGLNEKTDKASVFEQAARYLKFLRNKYGAQFDQAYCEKYFLEKS